PDRPLRDRARGAEDCRLRRRNRRAPGRGIDVRPARPGRTRDRLRHPHPAVPAGDEVPAERGQDRGRREAHHGCRLSSRHSRESGTRCLRQQRKPCPNPESLGSRFRGNDSKNEKSDQTTMTTKQFLLPDLGEGLPDATIVEWYVKEGDTIRLDDNLVSMETAKAVVDVPSPVSGKVLK